MNVDAVDGWARSHPGIVATVPVALLWATVGLWALLGYSIGGEQVALNLGMLFSIPGALVTVVYVGIIGYAWLRANRETEVE